ncbi:lipid A 3-O-deacylase [Ruegeria marisrubri]|uniref:Lipid A 3-O-deacylase n=1 Tax=Ruegeria marisrubri TaxID=1685379 RepID=A0A0X3TXK2_9RHOB|nr:acyloxyacyl hydrolase [Ruegeria marisrubri]KUJ80389.1 lipid A 3-O-deacylase [Ruegeria marisrubri]
MKPLIVSLAMLASASVANAQSLIFGAGYADYSHEMGDDQAIVSLEYQHRPFHEATHFSAGWGAAASVDGASDFHIGIGLYGIYDFDNRWFTEISVMPGYYDAGKPENEIGGSFQIRSLLAVGYAFDNGNRLSLAITHKSNASTNDFNPGVNTTLVRFHKSF